MPLEDWKQSLLGLRWSDELPPSLLVWIDEKTQSKELRRMAKALLSVKPMTGQAQNPFEWGQN
jgi:hypothetical protein